MADPGGAPTQPRGDATTAPTKRGIQRWVLALLPPLVALLLELALLPLFHPTFWFLFYPAVFLSSWIGGLRAGIVASAVSAVTVLWFLTPPQHSLAAAPGQYVAASVFFATGIFFGVFHERLRRANARIESALALSEQANERLQQAVKQQRIFTALIENSSDFIGIADPGGKPVYVNPAGRKLVGLAADHPVETLQILDCYPTDQRSFASDIILRSMVKQGHWQGETAFRNFRTEEAIPVSDTHFLIREPETGEVLGMGTVTRDISDIKRAREEAERARHQLEQANEAIASLVEQAPDGIFVSDLDGRYTDVNSAGCRMLGYTREEILGKNILDLIPVDRVEQLEREKAQMLKGQVQVSEHLARRKDGTYVPLEVSARILPDGRWQAVARDISVRKQLEEALRANQADLNRAQSVAKVGSWRLDVRRNELRWSDESYRIFGVPAGTPMTYEGFLACVHPDDRAYVEREWAAALRGEPYDIEHRVVADGKVKWVREKADLKFDEHGALVGGIGITHDISDEKRREEELREVRERYELALRGADLAAWDWNIETGEVVFNPRWAEMRGYRPDEIRGHVDSWTAGIHPEDYPRVKETLEEYFEGRSSEYEVEHRVLTKSGEWIWILDRGKVFARNGRGQPTRMVGTELDITSRKRAEEALRLAEAKASGIVSVSADAIISIDDQQRITIFNEGAEKIFGYPKEEAIGAPLDILFPERFRASHREHVEQFAAGGEVARKMGKRASSIFGRRKNGEEFPADASISRLQVSGTTILTVALRDITEQKRLEAEQQFIAEVGSVLASTLELDATLTSIGRISTQSFADTCVAYLVEAGGQVRRLKAVCRDPARDWICEALAQMPLDRSRAEAIWSELEANRSVLVEHVSDEMLASWGQSEEHLRVIRALDPKSFIMAPLFAHRKLFGALALISSAPARLYTPADVHLVEQIAQRAALAIAKALLYEEARRAVQTRDEVLGVVAHDLRNPLGTILMQAELLRAPGAGSERRLRKTADTIERSAKRMRRLIQDLLDVARLEQAQLSVAQGRVSATQVLSDSVEAQESLATAASLALEVEVSRDLPAVWADRDRLLQIFENLIGNAVKFTEAGGSIIVGASPRDGEVLFWVSDTGVGIAEEDLPYVFDRFWQATGERRGAGLGLPIVRGLVEAHGGRIWVESTLGHGTTFFFTIPTAPRAEVLHGVPARHAAH